jgi:hypothetical protein
MENNTEFQLAFIEGVPYWKHGNGDIFIFEGNVGDEKTRIGQLEGEKAIIHKGWKESVQQKLEQWRSSLTPCERENLRSNFIKSRKSRRNPRRSTKTKSVPNKSE